MDKNAINRWMARTSTFVKRVHRFLWRYDLIKDNVVKEPSKGDPSA